MKKENRKNNIEKISKEIEEKKKIPKGIKEKINSKIFENIIFIVIILLYLGALNLGVSNIPVENYLMDLRVFSMMLLVATIVIFELAYRKDKGDMWLHGIEIMLMSIFTSYLVHLYSIFYSTFESIIYSFGFIITIYFVVKILLIKKRIVKNYNKSLVDIGEIVKKNK